MRIVHLSDLHLGFRAYEATDRGWNLRERDLANAFRTALQEIVRVEPELVVVSGDVFDRPDPPSTALLTATRGLSMLRKQLPDVPVVVIAGERDSPPSPADPGPIAILDTLPGVEAAASAPRAVRFRRTGLHALLVPYRSTVEPPFPELRPDPDARWNVLVIRGRPRQEGPLHIDPGEWDYVAVGGPHLAEAWASNVRASGALERPGWNPWAATLEERGFGVADLERGTWEFHAIPGRAVVDLAPVRVAADDPDAGTRRLRELLQGVPGGIEGKLIRVPLRGDVSSPGDGVARGLLEAVRARSAHLEIELRGPGLARASDERMEMISVDADVHPALWSPSALELVGNASGSSPSLSLAAPGLVLLTSVSEATRARLAVELGAPVGIDAPTSSAEPMVRLHPAPPDGARRAALWAGHANPRSLLDAVLTGAARAQERRGPPRRGGSLGEGEARGAGARAKRGGDRRSDGSGDHAAAPESLRPTDEEVERWPADLASLERMLRDLRADSIEASGDLEARTLQWARERQDADSNLQAYRERARELQTNLRKLERDGPYAPCPTCGRPLREDLDGLVRTLRDELEEVVQDGRWWKSRRGQLEDKPQDIRELEARVLELHAGLEEAAERAQRARDGMVLDRKGESGAWPHGGEAGEDSGSVPGPRIRNVLRDAGTILGRITEGRLEGVRVDVGGLSVVDREGVTRRAIGTEAAALRFAVHLALWRDGQAHGVGVGALLIWEFHRTGADDQALPALELLGALGDAGGTVIVIAPPSVASRLPELFRDVVEVDADGPGRSGIRRHSAGVSSLVVRGEAAAVRRSEPH